MTTIEIKNIKRLTKTLFEAHELILKDKIEQGRFLLKAVIKELQSIEDDSQYKYFYVASLTYMAKSLFLEGFLKEAELEFKKLILLYPQYNDPSYYYSEFLIYQKRLAEAKCILQSLLASESNIRARKNIFLSISKIYFNENTYDKAEEYLITTILEMFKERPYFYHDILPVMWDLTKIGKYSAAILFFQNIIERTKEFDSRSLFLAKLNMEEFVSFIEKDNIIDNDVIMTKYMIREYLSKERIEDK